MAVSEGGRSGVGKREAVIDWARHHQAASLFIGALLIFLPTSAGWADWPHNNDAWSSATAAWSLGVEGNPWLEDFQGRTTWLTEAVDGHLASNRFLGTILPAAPFYAFTGLFTDSFSLWPSALSVALAAAATLVLLRAVFTKLTTPQVATLAAGVIGLTTPVWSIAADQQWPHSYTILGLAAALYGLAVRRYWLAGLALMPAILARPHLAATAAVLGLATAWQLRSLRPAVAIGVPSAAALGLLVGWNKTVYGVAAIDSGYNGGPSRSLTGDGPGMLAYLENLAGWLVSPGRGVLIVTPVLLLLLPFLRRAWRQAPGWARIAALGGLAYQAIQLQINHFAGADGFFGYRHGLEVLVMASPLLLLAGHALWARSRRWRLAALTLLGAQFILIFMGSVTPGTTYLLDAWTPAPLLAPVIDYPVAAGAALVAATVIYLVAVPAALRAARRREAITTA